MAFFPFITINQSKKKSQFLGYRKNSDTNQCQDINECATGSHNCNEESQRCDNTLGMYSNGNLVTFFFLIRFFKNFSTEK